MLTTRLRQTPRRIRAAAALGLVAATAGALAIAFSAGGTADAKGGTAKPPRGLVAPFVTATLPTPVFATDPALIHGFDETGFIQDMSAPSNAGCPDITDQARWGGTVKVNNQTITIPCNLVVQMPANTFKWGEFAASSPSLALGTGYPSFEVSLVGNEVDGEKIAALAFVSQQSLNTHSGTITGIDYAKGRLLVSSGGPGSPATEVEINDPGHPVDPGSTVDCGSMALTPAERTASCDGRFGLAHSPDPRLSVDDENPTIHAATGYPMCVPRVDPAGGDDPLCPKQNRPLAADGCRNFSQAGVPIPVSGELSAPAAGQVYCSQYVMPMAPGDPATPTTGPDARQQAPFEVGDYVAYSGTLVQDPAGDYISAHTVEANVGIYTQPGTQPSYLAIGEFGIGSADPNATSVNGAGQEAQDRIFLESETTDVQTPVDIFMLDADPTTADVSDRWITPFEMTGEAGGGITTQFTGPQPQRARIRATKAPSGLLSDPSRMVRVMARSLCGSPDLATAAQPAIDNCLAAQVPVANGLIAGQYAAPVFEYIFPEGVKPGDLTVPYDFWHMSFIRCGENSSTPEGVGPETPSPWGAELPLPPGTADPCAPAPAPVPASAPPAPPAPAAAPAPAPAAAPVVAGGAPIVAAATGKKVAAARAAAAAKAAAAKAAAAKKAAAKRVRACLKVKAGKKRAACLRAAKLKATRVR